jgi:N-acetylneuraminic acid mutarotase
MDKKVTLLLVLIFLTASCMIFAKSAFSSTELPENSWVPKAPMPQGGEVYGAAEVDGKIYAFGAYYYNGTTYYTSGKYDPATDSWSTIAPMPTGRIEFAIAVYESEIYVIGGKKTQGDVSLNTVEAYDPGTDSWTIKAPMPTARDSMEANVVNGKIYVISGQVSFREPAVFSDATEVYDPKTNSWAAGANIPNHVEGYASAVLQNKIYIIGGRIEEPPIGWHGVNTTQIYDPATDKWTNGACLPQTAVSAVACATNGSMAPKRIYVFAGFDEIGQRELNQVYDPVTDEWTAGAKQSFYGYGEVAVADLNDVMYVIGGSYSELVAPNPWGYTGNAGPVYNPPPPFIGINYQYTPIGYGASDRTAPRITVLSPENKNYPSSGVPITFTTDEPAIWMGYRLDGQQITDIDGNITLNGLASGSHNITLYAKDKSENTGSSETIDFTVANDQSLFLTIAIAAASVATVLVIGAALLVYRRKCTRREAAIISG